MFRNLFSPSKTKKSFGQSSLLHTKTDLASVQDGSENAIRQQVIQTLHRDLMRKSGIPMEWMACHTQVMVSRSKGTGMAVVLVVKHWDERLMSHTFAFQRALATEIIEFESAAEQWLHGITWRFEVASTCPQIDLPEKSFWNDLYTPAPTAAAVHSQVAELAALKANLAARQAEVADSRAQLAFSKGDFQAQAAQLAAQFQELAAVKRELAGSRAERATLLASMQHPNQSANQATTPRATPRAEFMPRKFSTGAGELAPASGPQFASASAQKFVQPTDSAYAELRKSAPNDAQAQLDLDRLFAIRDSALRKPGAPQPQASDAQGQAAAGYEPTQPSPLQR